VDTIPPKEASYLALAVIYGVWEMLKIFMQKKSSCSDKCLQQRPFVELDMRVKTAAKQISKIHETLIRVGIDHEKTDY
jgi:hypothetical protein